MMVAAKQNTRSSRRDLLRLGGAVVVAGAVVGCDALSTEPADSDSADGGTDRAEKEAPELARQVASGDLPPLERRLPTTPLVVEPTEGAGRYGATWNNPILGPADVSVLARTIEYDGVVRWDVAWTEVIPNVAEAVEIEADGAAYRFALREGMRWSDGEPFTADDILFAFHDVLFNEELFPAGPPARYISEDGTPATVEKLGDYGVRIAFAEPHGLFLDELATAGGADITMYPRHYLSEFHRGHNPRADEAAEREGYDSWADLFLARASFRETSGVPTLYPWSVSAPLGAGSRVVAERNPYYWKVDPDGRQLPYLDGVTFEVLDDIETILLKVTNGEFHFHTRHFNDLRNKPIVASGRTDGGYGFVSMLPSTNNEIVIMLNLTHRDPVLREVFQNKDFRIGLSHAIDREEIIDVVFQRQGTAAQPAPREGSAFYDEEFSTQYLAYNVDRANDHLDRAGFVERDVEGFRLGPDGSRIAFGVEVANPTLKDTWLPTMELVREHWREVGIDIRVVSEDRSLWQERVAGNEHDATVWLGEGGLKDELLYGFYYFPFHAGSRFAILWADWYASRGELGEEPPPEPSRQLELYDRLRREIDRDVQNELFAEIVRIGKEQFYAIGIVQLDEEYGIVANNFHNVPETMPFATIWPTPAPARPEQFFISG